MTAVSEIDHDYDLERPVPKLYADRDCRGLAQRRWAREEWVRQYGHFDSVRVSHGWYENFTSWSTPETAHCQAAVMSANLSCHHTSRYADPCQCVDGTVYRGACYYCDWEGGLRPSEEDALEDALDHAWPGWRELPVVESDWMKESGSKRAKAIQAWWGRILAAGYARDWLEQGGPIRTRRSIQGARPVFGAYHPAEGWDVCAEIDETWCTVSRGGDICPGLADCLQARHGQRRCRTWKQRREGDWS